jgi:hypothetical protein
MEEEFKTAESIEKWLAEDRGLPASVAAAVASALFDGDYVFPSSLLNIPRADLQPLNISPPHRNVLFNKLQQQSRQRTAPPRPPPNGKYHFALLYLYMYMKRIRRRLINLYYSSAPAF